MTDVAHRTANDGLDQFIPVRKSDILSALVEQGDCKSDEDRKKFRRLCDMLAAIYHYDYFKMLERLRDDYYYFSPEVAPHAAFDRDVARPRLRQSRAVARRGAGGGQFHRDCRTPTSARRIGAAPCCGSRIAAPLDDFRDVRFWRRGRHTESFEVARLVWAEPQ